MSTRARRRDGLAVLIALGLLGLAAFFWLRTSDDVELQRATVLAGLPPFPSTPDAGVRVRPATATTPTPVASAPPSDKLAAFALAPTENLAVIQVNALANSPFFARVKACLQLGALDGGAEVFPGVDLERDVDRVAMVPGGYAMSGALPADLAQRMAQQWPDAKRSTYRDVDIHEGKDGCVAQVSGLLLSGEPGRCQALVDRALQPTPPQAARDALESDVYTHTDLSALRSAVGELGPGLAPVVNGLDGITLRANVWDQVALSIDATPRADSKRQLETFASLARLSVEASQSQLADDPKWSALLDQANVRTAGGHLQVDLALPADALFDRLQLPCRGADAGVE
jgi:hypothetical protein